MSESMSLFGDWLGDELDHRGRRRRWLAIETGVYPETVSRWVDNEAIPDPANCKKIALALGIDPLIVLELAGHMEGIDAVARLREMLEAKQAYETSRLADNNVRRLEGRLDRRTIRVDVWGRVPADTIRDTHDEELEPVDVAVSALRGARSPFGLLIVGDCMRRAGMFPGDVVICDRDAERKPKDGELVVIRLHDGVTFKRWCVIDKQTVELRDGDGIVAHVLNALIDDYVIEGFYVTFQPLAPR